MAGDGLAAIRAGLNRVGATVPVRAREPVWRSELALKTVGAETERLLLGFRLAFGLVKRTLERSSQGAKYLASFGL
jgi:hypothetical protein